MKNAFNFKVILFSIIAILYALACWNDYLMITENTEEYINVYQIGSSDKWELKSIDNFQLWMQLQIGVVILYVVLNVTTLITKNKIMRFLVTIADILLILSLLSIWYS